MLPLAEEVQHDEFIADDELIERQRRYLAQYLTPRCGLDGRLIWPIGELTVDHD